MQSIQAEESSCNSSILNFLTLEKGTLSIPDQIDGKIIQSVEAIVYFRESHGGYRSCFSFKEIDSGQMIDLFCEVQWSDEPFNLRGDNDWLGSVEGGILGESPSVKKVTIKPGATYVMMIHGDEPPHNAEANSLKTHINDPVFDNDLTLFTFYEETRLEKIKSLEFKHQEKGVSTIIGFEDQHLAEKEKDYNDIILEICLRIN